MRFTEDATLSNSRITKDGYLVADVRCARAGIQQYLGSEMGINDKKIINVYRPVDEVFNKESMSTFAGKPVTDNHPGVMVDASNWKQYARGDIGEEVARDGEFIRVPIKLMDASLIEKVQSGKRELSMGYECDIDMKEGVTDDGVKYDAVMRNLTMNHLAVVDKGRAGKECSIKDNNAISWSLNPIEINDEGITMTEKLQTVIVDGIPLNFNEQGAAAVTRMQGKLADSVAAHKAEVKSLTDSVAAKDTELAKKDAEIEKLKSNAMSDADIDKMVIERAELTAKAKAIYADGDYSGKTAEEIKSTVVSHAVGDAAVKDKSPEYIAARFDVLCEDKSDTFRNTLKDGGGAGGQKINDNGQSEYENRINNAWKGE